MDNNMSDWLKKSLTQWEFDNFEAIMLSDYSLGQGENSEHNLNIKEKIEKNKKLWELAEKNTVRNKDGLTVWEED